MQINITEKDYEIALGPKEVKNLRSETREAILGDDDKPSNQAILDALPKVIVERFKKMIPPDYEVKELTIKVQISGQPFGVGVASDATVKFGPKPPSTT